MPELPEVETVKETLKCNILGKKITNIEVYYDKIIQGSCNDFISALKNEKIVDIKRVGKYLVFVFEKHIMLSHLRMEGKYNYIESYDKSILTTHDHVVFCFENQNCLVYNDTRKFGTM